MIATRLCVQIRNTKTMANNHQHQNTTNDHPNAHHHHLDMSASHHTKRPPWRVNDYKNTSRTAACTQTTTTTTGITLTKCVSSPVCYFSFNLLYWFFYSQLDSLDYVYRNWQQRGHRHTLQPQPQQQLQRPLTLVTTSPRIHEISRARDVFRHVSRPGKCFCLFNNDYSLCIYTSHHHYWKPWQRAGGKGTRTAHRYSKFFPFHLILLTKSFLDTYLPIETQNNGTAGGKGTRTMVDTMSACHYHQKKPKRRQHRWRLLGHSEFFFSLSFYFINEFYFWILIYLLKHTPWLIRLPRSVLTTCSSDNVPLDNVPAMMRARLWGT
jgi:hypothetical protein